MILLKVSGLFPNREVHDERLPMVELVDILAPVYRGTMAILCIMLLRVFMGMATISKWCLVHT